MLRFRFSLLLRASAILSALSFTPDQLPARAIQEHSMEAIHSGVAWYDQRGQMVSAHGAGILKEDGRFYLFGEFKSDEGNAFRGFSCYSSPDLVNWTFEGIPIPPQAKGPLGPDRVGERPKVLKCPRTGEFVMFIHTDNLEYRDPAVGYATSSTIDGEYTFQGPLLHSGKPIRKWDMGIFQDDDGTGYLVTHHGSLYRLSDDYKSVAEQVVDNMTEGCESPAMFKHEGLYYWLGSGLTGWERNDNYYFTATALEGPWERQGFFAPEGSRTWNSQTTFVLPVIGTEATTFVFMGDRWAFPRQNSAATYVWQPLQFDGARIHLPEYYPAWKIDLETGAWRTVPLPGKPVEIDSLADSPQLRRTGDWERSTDEAEFTDWRAKEAGSQLAYTFTGTQIGFIGVGRPDGGFGEVRILDTEGNLVLKTLVESYCAYPEASLKFLSPVLEHGEYTLSITVQGEHFNWTTKNGTRYGSSDDYFSVQRLLLQK